MSVTESRLYQYLRFLEKYRGEYNAKGLFNLFLGYKLAFTNECIPESCEEAWLADFNEYIDGYLSSNYYGGIWDRLSKNFGDVISEIQANDKDGVELFYKILDEFVSKHQEG